MALFQRHPQNTLEQQPLYTLGQEKTVVLVGLGNPGKKYQITRHNAGFLCLDAFADTHEFPSWTQKKDLKSLITFKNLGDTRVILVKPSTMMNLSGEAVQAVTLFYKIAETNLVVVHDELDIPFGQIRLRLGGSAAGHNGLKSLIKHMGEGFGRVRIGVKADTKMDAADFVLAPFSQEEQKHLKAMTQEVVSILTDYVYSGQLAADTRSFLT